MMRFSKLTKLFLTTMTAVWFGISAAAAEEPKLLGKYSDWAAYSYGSGSSRICYVMSEPKEMQPRGANRGDVFLMITHRPGQNVTNEVSMRAGYPFSDRSRPFAQIGSDKFQMFSGVSEGGENRYWAWLKDTSDEDRMATAMRRGSSMTVKGTSQRGTLTTDRYSLSGITAALNKIDDTCR
ncbi:MAG: hypothetical protein NXH87_17585 [Rhodobiaceae bacterium]|nr:hypothetical protein [Rhodobiaceae bacterium]